MHGGGRLYAVIVCNDCFRWWSPYHYQWQSGWWTCYHHDREEDLPECQSANCSTGEKEETGRTEDKDRVGELYVPGYRVAQVQQCLDYWERTSWWCCRLGHRPVDKQCQQPFASILWHRAHTKEREEACNAERIYSSETVFAIIRNAVGHYKAEWRIVAYPLKCVSWKPIW